LSYSCFKRVSTCAFKAMLGSKASNAVNGDSKNFQVAQDQLYLVTGGSGFLGRHIVQCLLDMGRRVRVLDLVESFEDERVELILGDVRNIAQVRQACRGVTCVFHCAALTGAAAFRDSYAVNVQGTAHVIKACVVEGVQRLVFTSSTSVVNAGDDIKNGDEESLTYPRRFLDHYSATKAMAEQLVIKANGTPIHLPPLATTVSDIEEEKDLVTPTLPSSSSSSSASSSSASASASSSPSSPSSSSSRHCPVLLTCCLRPHVLFGPRDPHFIARLVERARRGDLTHMIGDGSNVSDFTFVDNAVHAHLLAALALQREAGMIAAAVAKEQEKERDGQREMSMSMDVDGEGNVKVKVESVPERPISISSSAASSSSSSSLSSVSSASSASSSSSASASSSSVLASSLASCAVAGQCFFITNGEPRLFWGFVKDVLNEVGCVGPTKSIPFVVAYAIAWLMELIRKLLGERLAKRFFRPSITRHTVVAMGCHAWFSHAKASRAIGYVPLVSLQDGLR